MQVGKLILAVDEFLGTRFTDQGISSDTKKREAERFLTLADNEYKRATDASLKNVLGERIERLRRSIVTISRVELPRAEYTSLRDKYLQLAKVWLASGQTTVFPTGMALSRTSKLLEDLRAIAKPPSEEELAVMQSLTTLLNTLRAKKAEGASQIINLGDALPTFQGVKTPVALDNSLRFREEVSKNPPTNEASLKVASYHAIQIVGDLSKTLASYYAEEHERWYPFFADEIRKVSELRGRWQRQLEAAKKEETKAMQSAWFVEKNKVQTATYVSAKRTAVREGKLNTMVEASANSFENQIPLIVSSIDMVMKKAEQDKLPELLPIGRVATIIAKARLLVPGILPRVTQQKGLSLQKKLNLLEAKLAEMKNLKTFLS